MSWFLNRHNPLIPPYRKANSVKTVSLQEDLTSSLITRGKRGFRKLFPPAHSCAVGFTLIEVLVSVTILSVVLAAIYSTFFLAHRAVEGMDESLVKLQEARRMLDILRCELDSTFYHKADLHTLLQIKDRDSYGKSASELTFTTFSNLQPGLVRISYYIEECGGSLTLLKKMESPWMEEKTEGFGLIEELEGFSIEAKYQDQWVKTWDAGLNEGTPEEIRINLVFRLKDRTVTLSDISRPRIYKPI